MGFVFKFLKHFNMIFTGNLNLTWKASFSSQMKVVMIMIMVMIVTKVTIVYNR